MAGDADDQRERENDDALSASEQAENAEVMLDRDLEDADPEKEVAHRAADHAERLEQHSEQTDTPVHPESPPRREAPPAS